MLYQPLMYLKSKTVILETDFRGDVDDVGALSLLLYYSKKYGFKVGGVCVNDYTKDSVYAVSSLLFERGFFDVPVGICDSSDATGDDIYNGTMSSLLSEDQKEAAERNAMPAGEFYKKILNEAQDGCVDIISVGFFNTMYAAFCADKELFERKVERVVIMGGSFNYFPDYKEFNVFYAAKQAASSFIGNFSGKMIFSGFELGYDVFTDLTDMKDSKDPVVMAYGKYSEYRRHSWDPLTVDFAVTGEGDVFRLSGNIKVRIVDGVTVFTEKADGNCAFIIPNRNKSELSDYITAKIKESLH